MGRVARITRFVATCGGIARARGTLGVCSLGVVWGHPVLLGRYCGELGHRGDRRSWAARQGVSPLIVEISPTDWVVKRSTEGQFVKSRLSEPDCDRPLINATIRLRAASQAVRREEEGAISGGVAVSGRVRRRGRGVGHGWDKKQRRMPRAQRCEQLRGETHRTQWRTRGRPTTPGPSGPIGPRTARRHDWPWLHLACLRPSWLPPEPGHEDHAEARGNKS